ncbi:MAG: M48 family metalloprotease, partial [Sphingopyxis sp.]
MTAFSQHPARHAPKVGALFRILLTIVAMVAMVARPAMAQSILRDAETEALFQDMMDPLLVAAGLQPG